ncbi:ribose-5-phosphate isomerase RpiA [Agrilactobacillus fermenti]|uniref:ribose-5-phosphate isomerase RpiA n=1 Tax=Agrilactobacillus fermenti TaxID=2586909 RepID=UPI001E32B078|nr:ribose-5-phosphate isomerase RpiA [Agrilactobacillus fermenti]MCD2255414.1 ribose-5-phosphate isomerase RpiA [Agrilactobacillus fermenti]
MDIAEQKRIAAEKSVDFVKDGMIVGLGTGSTVLFMVNALAKRVKQEHLHITGVATSKRTHKQAESLGIPMKSIDEVDHVDLTIDGADEVDKNFQGIKGGGAAHAFEKIVATSSTRNIWIVDESKLVDRIGRFPLPLEVIPYGSKKVFNRLQHEGLNPKFRKDDDGNDIITHSGNYVIDLHLGVIDHPHLLANWLSEQVGILEHGLFLDTVNTIVVGTPNGPKILEAYQI